MSEAAAVTGQPAPSLATGAVRAAPVPGAIDATFAADATQLLSGDAIRAPFTAAIRAPSAAAITTPPAAAAIETPPETAAVREALDAASASQVAPTPGGPVAFLGTIVLSWLFFGFAAQVAATFLLGDVPWRRAAVVGVVPAVTVAALISYPPAVILAVALAADFFAVHAVYRLRYRTAAAVTLMHAVAAISIGVPLAFLVELLGTAPG